jgi:homoserine O-succinyltransferase/O-acetyltransferase
MYLCHMKQKLAIIDLNAGIPNQGMRCITEIAYKYDAHFDIDTFDLRVKGEIPTLDYDLFIFSGGPGNPLEGDGIWDQKFYNLIQEVWDYNKYSEEGKKFMFFICHSFQMACNYFQLGTITERKSTSFGVMPIHKTREGAMDPILGTMPDPFHVIESRDWQLVQPNLQVIKDKGAKILALEKIRTHVEFERAIMAVRFSDEIMGTQFHPEADPEGMKIHFQKQENRDKVINNFGSEKYDQMMTLIDDEEKIYLTHKTILPKFIERALNVLNSQAISLV